MLLDENVLAAQTGFVDVGVREPSPDDVLLAWSADTSGAEVYELRIRDLRTGEDLPEVIPRSFPGVAWDVASRHLFYLVADDRFRPFQVWRHEVGTAASADVLVFEEQDQRFELTLHCSRSGELAIITAASRNTTEVWVIPLERPLDGPVLIEPRQQGTEYRIDHARAAAEGQGDLYVVTDLEATEFTLMQVALAAPARAGWTPVRCPAIAPARDDTRLLSCDVLADHLVLTVRRDGVQLLVITDHDGGNVREIPPSLTAGSIRVEHAEDYDRGSVIVIEESLVEPPAWYQLDLPSATRQLLKRMEVPGYDPAQYVTERLAAPAPDGTPIPVTLARRNDTPLDGTAPCLLYGYGAYEACSDPEFDRSLPSLLDRGVVYAIAHIRGGGEGGRTWWHQGMLQAKPTTFTRLPGGRRLAGGRRRACPGRRQPDRLPRAVRRGAAPGGRVLDAAGPVARGGRRSSVRRLRQHDARCLHPADRDRMGGVGRSARSRRLCLHAVIHALRQSAVRPPAGAAGDRCGARRAGGDPRTGKVGGEAASHGHRGLAACCSGRSSASGPTAGRRAAAPGCATRRRSRRSSWTRWGSPRVGADPRCSSVGRDGARGRGFIGFAQREVAGRLLRRSKSAQRRLLFGTQGLRSRAARSEAAAGRRIDRAGKLAADPHVRLRALGGGIGHGDRLDQRARCRGVPGRR